MAHVQAQGLSGGVNNGSGGANNQFVTSLYVGDLEPSVTETQLYEFFNQVGQLLTVRLCTDLSTRRSLGYGYVNYGNPQDAARALELLNFTPLNGKPIRIMYSNRDPSLRRSGAGNIFIKNLDKGIDQKALHDTFSAFGNILSCKLASDPSGANLYVKNLDDSISDEKLKELFSQYGAITSCKVMRDPNGVSKGSGFVAFSTPEEASKALAEMNGKMIVNKPLYVAQAQRKEDRRARLQAQFSQMRPLAMAPSVGPRMPMYPPGGPGLGQQIFYGQAPPMFPPQPGFGYQQQLVPGMRPGGAPMPNFFVPMVQQGQQGQRPGGRRAGAVQQNQQPAPLMQHQMLPRGRVYRYPPGRGLPDVSIPNVGGGMMSVPYDMSGMPMRDAPLSQPIPIGALASALANATPDQQRTMLGENLYPLVEQLEPDAAAKVTGMLLEMDQTEVLHLLESPEALKAKVAEAMEVLRTVAQQQAGGAADQLASLSLNDSLVS
ncbi:hypothetical protein V6N12_060636 [Hibiscus sabdariffa]|uniref:Polyadenylate-binding protein n=1 Tax=Hibiscus sabdariffa TaxID=183260 RepID=A0ABR2D6S9_9ROSI